MNEDERSSRGRTGSRRVSSVGSFERAITVAAAYDDVCGQASFVITALEHGESWLAVAEGAELSLSQWR